MNKQVKTPNGRGTVTGTKRGWVTVKLDDGTVKNFRPKDVREVGAAPDGYVVAGAVTYDPNRYTEHKDVRTESGRPVYDTGDKAAAMLRGKSLDEQYEIAAKVLDESPRKLRQQYEHLNAGMQRMNLSNRMRGALRH